MNTSRVFHNRGFESRHALSLPCNAVIQFLLERLFQFFQPVMGACCAVSSGDAKQQRETELEMEKTAVAVEQAAQTPVPAALPLRAVTPIAPRSTTPLPALSAALSMPLSVLSSSPSFCLSSTSPVVVASSSSTSEKMIRSAGKKCLLCGSICFVCITCPCFSFFCIHPFICISCCSVICLFVVPHYPCCCWYQYI